MKTELLQQQIIDYGMLLLEHGLVSRTWGNISVRINENEILISPSGRQYNELSGSDIVKVNIQSGQWEGCIKPSSELPLHLKIYQQRNDVKAIIHTHQSAASTLAVARRSLPAVLDDQAQLLGSVVKVSKYRISGTKMFANSVCRALGKGNAALIANHGAICVGRNLEEAFNACLILEKAAEAYIGASVLGKAKSLGKINATVLHQVYLKKYSKQNQKNK